MREIHAANQVYVVEFADVGLGTESDLGYYELKNEGLNEKQHRHSGQIRMPNKLNQPRGISVIVGIARKVLLQLRNGHF